MSYIHFKSKGTDCLRHACHVLFITGCAPDMSTALLSFKYPSSSSAPPPHPPFTASLSLHFDSHTHKPIGRNHTQHRIIGILFIVLPPVCVNECEPLWVCLCMRSCVWASERVDVGYLYIYVHALHDVPDWQQHECASWMYITTAQLRDRCSHAVDVTTHMYNAAGSNVCLVLTLSSYSCMLEWGIFDIVIQKR